MKRSLLLTFAAAACASALAACVAIQRAPGVLIASRPAGARIVVDGDDSGFVTPCTLALTREQHAIDLMLDGYQPARIAIDKGGDTWIMHWQEAYLDYHTWHFPLWLNMQDFWTPIKVERSFEPGRVFVALRLNEKSERPRRGGR
jgi:hypothetical protein